MELARLRRAFMRVCGVFLLALQFMPSPAAAEKRLAKHPWVTLSGELSVIYVDTFANKDRQLVYLKRSKAKKKVLKLLGSSPDLRTGDQVTLRARTLRHNAVAVRAKNDLKFKTARAATALLVGTRKLAIVRIQALDGGPSCSAAQMVDRMWTGTRSINGLYRASSYAQLSFAQDSNADGQPDVFQVSINQNTLGRCNEYGAIASAADTALSALGVNLSAYHHRVYVLPTNVRYSQLDANGNPVPSSEKAAECYWAGMGQVGGAASWIPGEWCGVTDDSTDVITHEVGHNLGFNHARVDANQDGVTDTPDGEYSDVSCPMGRANRNYRHFNLVHKIQAGWVASTTTVTTPGIFTLSALDGASASASAPHALILSTRIANMYLSYRAAVDSYSSPWQSGYYGKTSIHWGMPSPGPSNFIIALGDGQSYRDPDTGTVITQLSHTASTVQVRIEFGLAPAAPSGLVVN